LLRLESAAGGSAPQRDTRAWRRSRISRNNRSVFGYEGANLKRPGGLRDERLAGGLENQKQQGNDQTPRCPYDRRISLIALGRILIELCQMAALPMGIFLAVGAFQQVPPVRRFGQRVRPACDPEVSSSA
jgi:hypothetical protein